MPMRFRLSPDGHIVRTQREPSVADSQAMAFASEPEFQRLAGAWPMQRFVEIWNQLPGVPRVQRFESRKTAVARIWRAIQPEVEQSLRASALPSASPVPHRVSFREGSKAAEVCMLLSRPQGVTLREIITATGWQAHTVRAFLSRSLRKQGRTVRSLHRDGDCVYYTHAEQEADLAPAPPR